jgi:hypothetical protein
VLSSCAGCLHSSIASRFRSATKVALSRLIAPPSDRASSHQGGGATDMIAARPRRYAAGNVSHPVTASPQDGCCKLAPRRPQTVQRAFRRSTSDDASAPHRTTNGTRATATRWPHASQRSHSQYGACSSAPSVGTGTAPRGRAPAGAESAKNFAFREPPCLDKLRGSGSA